MPEGGPDRSPRAGIRQPVAPERREGAGDRHGRRGTARRGRGRRGAGRARARPGSGRRAGDGPWRAGRGGARSSPLSGRPWRCRRACRRSGAGSGARYRSGRSPPLPPSRRRTSSRDGPRSPGTGRARGRGRSGWRSCGPDAAGPARRSLCRPAPGWSGRGPAAARRPRKPNRGCPGRDRRPGRRPSPARRAGRPRAPPSSGRPRSPPEARSSRPRARRCAWPPRRRAGRRGRGHCRHCRHLRHHLRGQRSSAGEEEADPELAGRSGSGEAGGLPQEGESAERQGAFEESSSGPVGIVHRGECSRSCSWATTRRSDSPSQAAKRASPKTMKTTPAGIHMRRPASCWSSSG